MARADILAAFIVFASILAAAPLASTVTLTGGCPAYPIGANSSYITFNVTNTGDGTAANLTISTGFPGVDSRNSTAIAPEVGPAAGYSHRFFLSSLPGQGSYALNINATYLQDGTRYSTVFPCIVYVGAIVQGPLVEAVSVSGGVMLVNITNSADQSVDAQLSVVVPPGFKASDPQRAAMVSAGGSSLLRFQISSPSYTGASFPVTGELSYSYNGIHYAQVASAAIAFGSGATGGGIGLSGWVFIAMIVIILVLIAASLVLNRRGARKGEVER